MPFEEKKYTCPYNPYHQILPARMGVHLTKCRRQHPHVSVRICPFNSLHHVVTDDYDDHVATCKDRTIVESTRIVTKHPYEMDVRPMPEMASNVRRDPDEEDWEAEMEGNVPFDPTRRAKEKGVLRYIQGATKSERRRFREEEAERHAQLAAEKTSQDTSLANSTKSTIRQVQPEAPQPLRRPNLNKSTLNDSSFMYQGRGRGSLPVVLPPPPVAAVGRGRGAALAKLQRERLNVGKAVSECSEPSTFATAEYKSMDDSIVAGNLRPN